MDARDSSPVNEETGGVRRILDAVRAYVRTRETALVLIAVLVGIFSGAAVTLMSTITQKMHEVLYMLEPGVRLSGSGQLVSPWLILVPAVGGLVMGLGTLALKRWHNHPIVDPIEANALHGGRMSFTDSIIVVLQTMLSNGVGASLGLEAGYSQIGAGFGSRLGVNLHLRRSDLRILVGAGAAAGIGAAFNEPLMGAFYGFEIIIGFYSIPAAAPVLVATLSGVVTARLLGNVGEHLPVVTAEPLMPIQFLPYLGLGLLAAGMAVLLMRLITTVEALFAKSTIPAPLRPAIAGLGVGLLGLYSPQVLSDGHGALHLQVESPVTAAVAIVFGLKMVASGLSVGSGFRGGLFFASLFLGALMGKLYAWGFTHVLPDFAPDMKVAAIVGMGALAVGVIGGPLTMSFLALEMTGNLGITIVVLAAAIVCSLTVRETFGFSFSTWRLHLRGESIRGAQDVGWMRSLTVERMMRKDVRTFPVDGTIAEFRETKPLGAGQRVILADKDGRYEGIVLVADAHASSVDPTAPVSTLARHVREVLLASMNVKEAALAFDHAGAEELAVVDDLEQRHVMGLLTEAYTLRRYAEELDKVRRGITGDD